MLQCRLWNGDWDWDWDWGKVRRDDAGVILGVGSSGGMGWDGMGGGGRCGD